MISPIIFSTGTYIENLKASKVIPIFKEKGSNLDYDNYSPIFFLSNINKIIEKLMHIRVTKFLDKNNCIYDLQFGFRKRHSTTHALMYLVENVRKAMDDKLFACSVFIDLQKSFATVDHEILFKNPKIKQ